jgi:DNA repair protein RecN (Recombination protein N)
VLAELHVVDLGIVADLDLTFADGMVAITGETGAGKTLVVEALGLLAGERADAALVRDGAGEARVEGRFVADGHETVLARVVPRDGRSRAYLDGRLATVGELADEAARLLELHGQHAHQSLLDPATQRDALDRFAGEPVASALAHYRAARTELRRLAAELDGLGGDARARAREIDLLRFQRHEIDDARLDDPGEDEQLAELEARLADAGAIRDALGAAYAALEDGALDAVGTAVAALGSRRADPELAARLTALQAETADLARELRVAAEAVEDDPMRADEVRNRRRLLRDLTRKYGESLAEVMAYRDEVASRLELLESYEARAAALERERARAEAEQHAATGALTAARASVAAPLAREIEGRLRELAMPRAGVEVLVEPGEPGEGGADRVTILLAPNPGETARPLARAASGGELARTMLAVRVVLSHAPPTLVFDEVDAGIGGEAGTAVGRMLAELGRSHQVFCVTHLAQVAACASAQVVVGKHVERVDGRERTVARAATVEGEARVGELSRMLGGLGESAHARRHAEELLAGAVGADGAAPTARTRPARRRAPSPM